MRRHEMGPYYRDLVLGRLSAAPRVIRNEERKLKAIYEELRRHPARYRQVLDGIVIYERMPRWMTPVMPGPGETKKSRGRGRTPG